VLKALSELRWIIRDFQLVHSARSAGDSIYTVVDSWPLLDNAGRGS
jgi:2'-5' RNA ligase